MRAMKTKMMQPRIQAARAVSPIESEGVVQRAEVKRLTNTFVKNFYLEGIIE